MNSEKRTEVIAMRLSEREVKIIEDRARAQALSVSSYVRLRLFPEKKDARDPGIQT